MERLDQGHLCPILVVPRQTCLGRESSPASGQWEASTLAKSYSNSGLIAIRNIYICEPSTTKEIYSIIVVNRTGEGKGRRGGVPIAGF
jgi:hypothetical protein